MNSIFYNKKLFSNRMSLRRVSQISSSKENINISYHDLTSPLTSYGNDKQKTLLKNTINNSFSTKLRHYQKGSEKIMQQLSTQDLKAGSVIYQIPQFYCTQVTYDVSDAIKKKVDQIKNDMVTHLPQILTKSSNFNAKKLENIYSHRANIIELQSWLKQKLKNPPKNLEQSIEYKNMIMGVGMKDLIRIINKRCLQEGKMVNDVWEITWQICSQIILYLSKRAKKCQEILQEQLVNFNKGKKHDYNILEQKCFDQENTIKQLEQKNVSLLKQLNRLSHVNEKIMHENRMNNQKSNSFNNEFLNILEENLAMYLHIGDKTKREWIKKMYHQVGKARQSIQQIMKNQINKTIGERLKEERIYSDDVEEFQMDNQGNFIVGSENSKKNRKRKGNGKRKRKNKQKGASYQQGEQCLQNSQNTQQLQNLEEKSQNQDQQSQQSEQTSQYQGDDVCLALNEELQKQFEKIEQEIQTDYVDTMSVQIQYQAQIKQDKQISTDCIESQQIGINTEFSEVQSQKKQNKIGKPKQVRQSKVLKQVRQSKVVKDNRQSKVLKDSRQSKVLRDSRQSKVIKPSIVKNSTVRNQRKSQVALSIENKNKSLEASPQKEPNIDKSIEKLRENINQNIFYVCKDCNVKKTQQEYFQQTEETSYQKINNKKKSVSIPRFERKISIDREDKKINKKKSNFMSPLKRNSLIQQNSRSNKQINLNKLSNIAEYKVVQDQQESEVSQMNYINQDGSRKTTENTQNDGQDGQQDLSLLRTNKTNKTVFRTQGGQQKQARSARRRDSTLIHDINYKRDIQSRQSQLKIEAPVQIIKGTELPLHRKQPYFMFFMAQISQANQQYINGNNFQPSNSEYVLDNYFNMAQQINYIPDNKIIMSQKQMQFMIERNLMPIIIELLSSVKKAVAKNTVQKVIKTFHSLPFIIMNKFSTKYGVKILAIKNMKLLLSSLKKIQTITNRYKTLRLMLFTDCRAQYSQDLFVYLLVIAKICPHSDVDKPVNFQEVGQIRNICQKYLTAEKKIYEQFEELTSQTLGFNQTQQQLGSLKLAPLLRSIITSYRMFKINRIQELGFIYLMLKKDNCLDYPTFSFFISCLKIQTETKVKIVKTFLANCDLKNKQKKMAMSQSAYAKFLIRCPELTFDFLQQIIRSHRIEVKNMKTNVAINFSNSTLKRMSEQHSLTKLQDLSEVKSRERVSLNLDFKSTKFMLTSNQRLETQKQILVSSKEQKNTQKSENRSKDSQKFIRKEKNNFSICYTNVRKQSQIPKQIRDYSYFTFQIAKFLQNHDETKFMTVHQRQFIQNYLQLHVMNCQVEEVVGLIDYFSSQMLEIICLEEKYLDIKNDKISVFRSDEKTFEFSD